MALIKENYDLSGGDVFSDEVDSPANVNLAWKVESSTNDSQVVILEWWGTIGNESSNDNILGINATKLKIKVVPPTGATGTLNLWAINA